MPKVHNTRLQKACDLVNTVKKGPAFSSAWGNSPFSVEDAKEDYKIWSTSWILPKLLELIPELKDPRAETFLKKLGLIDE